MECKKEKKLLLNLKNTIMEKIIMEKKKFYYYLVEGYNEETRTHFFTLSRSLVDMSDMIYHERISKKVYELLKHTAIDNGGILKIIDIPD